MLDSIGASSQRLVCVAWPENDEQYPDRQSFLLAIEEMMTEPFVADAISVGLNNGWMPNEPGPDFVVQYDENTFTVLGPEPP